MNCLFNNMSLNYILLLVLQQPLVAGFADSTTPSNANGVDSSPTEKVRERPHSAFLLSMSSFGGSNVSVCLMEYSHDCLSIRLSGWLSLCNIQLATTSLPPYLHVKSWVKGLFFQMSHVRTAKWPQSEGHSVRAWTLDHALIRWTIFPSCPAGQIQAADLQSIMDNVYTHPAREGPNLGSL